MKRLAHFFIALLVTSPAIAGDKPLVIPAGFQQPSRADAPQTDRPETSYNGNPSIAGGLTGIAPDANGTLANNRELTTLSGSRSSAVVSRTIEVSDGQRGPASKAGISTAASASYGLSFVGIRPNWNTSRITGEMDGVSLWLRQASGDTAGILSNIGVRSGFATFAESYTFSADDSGAAIRGVRTQIGVVNPRDGGEYGFVAIADRGTGLATAFRAQNNGPATWADYFTAVNSTGKVVARIAGTGSFAGSAFIATGIAPTNNTGSCTSLRKIRGGNAAGTFSTSGSCPRSTTIRMVFSSAAPNGWVCNFQDQTTAITFRQTANTTTTCTVALGGATGAADAIVYSAIAF